jgi:hypothetical protein
MDDILRGLGFCFAYLDDDTQWLSSANFIATGSSTL